MLALAALLCAIYAEFTDRMGLQLLAVGILLLLIGGAYALGLFRQDNPAVPQSPTQIPAQWRPEAAVAVVERLAVQHAPQEEPVGDMVEETDPASGTEDQLYMVFARLAGVTTADQFRDQIDQIIADHNLSQLSASDVDRLAATLDSKDLLTKAFVRTPGIAIARQVRGGIDVEFAGTSWLGGMPTLGDIPWPRDSQGRAMHHLAQIDLSTLPLSTLPEGLPDTGALAFFMTTTGDGSDEAKTIYIPKIGRTATDPPQDLRTIYAGPDWGFYVKGHARETAPISFPRWPVDLIALPMSAQCNDDDAHALIADLLPRQTGAALSPEQYRKELPDFARPWFWDSAHRVVNSLRIARDDINMTIAAAVKRVEDWGDEYRSELATLMNEQDAFSQFVDEISIWAVSHEPWDKMSVADAATLKEYFDQVRDNGLVPAHFQPFYKYTQGELLDLRDATEATLLAAANGPPEVFALLPEAIRDDIDARHRIASEGRWHQMFGLGTKVGTAVADHSYHHLLLQLQSDQLVNWMWGNAGVVQFWITEEALKDQNWDSVEMTLEAR